MAKPLVVLLALLVLSHAACPPDLSAYTTWPTAWNKAGVAVTITASQKIVVTTSPGVVLGQVTIDGILRFADANLQFNSTGILIRAGGSLIAGTAECPIANKLYFTLHGAAPSPRDKNVIGSDPFDNVAFGSKGIVSATKGTLQMYGKYTGPTWTHISKTASVGSKIITLVEPVSWSTGDLIFLTNTDFPESLNKTIYPKMWAGDIRPDQHEKRTIVSVSADKKTITLDSALLYNHYADSHIKGEVGLLTRRIVIQGDEQSDAEAFGAHVMIRSGPSFASTVLSGVEFYRNGQTAVLGRYPIHFHVNHQIYGMGARLSGNSIHNSYQRCVSIHETHGVLIEDNVAFNITGHCYFLEDGSEMGNTFNHNLGAKVLPMVPPLLYHDGQPSVFWIANPNNTFTNNAAVGSVIGYWYALPVNAPNGAGGIAYPTMIPRGLPLGGFSNNIVHSMIDWCIDSATMDAYTSLRVEGWGGPNLIYANTTVYKCGTGALWSRGRPSLVDGGYWADFGSRGFWPLNGQIVRNVTLIGRSDNVGLYSPSSESCGITNYDTGGATGSMGNTFVNFTGYGYGAFCDTVGSPAFIPPVNWGIRNKLINSNPTFISGGSVSYWKTNPRAFLDDGSASGVPYGAFMAGYQPYLNVTGNGGTWSSKSNSITIPYFHGGMVKMALNPSDGAIADVPTTDTTVYSTLKMYRPNTYWRPLGQSPTAPGIHATFWFGYQATFPVNTMWSLMLLSKDTGMRRTLPSSFSLVLELAKPGDWLIVALPYPKKPSFNISISNKWNFTPVQAFKDLVSMTYFWNAEDNHMYMVANCPAPYVRGSSNYYARSDYSDYRSQCTVQIDAVWDTTDQNRTLYTPPKVPTVVPEWTKYTKFSARMYSKVGDVGALAQIQLYKKGFNGYPAIVWQTYQNQTDYNHRMRFKDANGKVLWNTDKASLIGAGNMRSITTEFWNQINQGLVYVAMDIGDKEIMRGALLSEDASSNTVMTTSDSKFVCTPTYNTFSLFDDAWYDKNAFKLISQYSGAAVSSYASLCGSTSMYAYNNYVQRTPLNVSIAILPSAPLANYATLEFAVKGNTTDDYISLQVWSLDKNSKLTTVNVDGSNNFNAIVDSHRWAIVRIPLSKLGGSSITTLGLYAITVNPDSGSVSLFVDQMRLSTAAISPTLSFAKIVQTSTPGMDLVGTSAAPDSGLNILFGIMIFVICTFVTIFTSA